MIGILGGALAGGGEALERWGAAEQANSHRLNLVQLQNELDTKRATTLEMLRAQNAKDQTTHATDEGIRGDIARTDQNIRQAQQTPYTLPEGSTRVDPAAGTRETAPKTPTPLTPEDARLKGAQAERTDAETAAIQQWGTRNGTPPRGPSATTPRADPNVTAINRAINDAAKGLKDDPSWDPSTLQPRKAIATKLLAAGYADDANDAAAQAMEAPVPSRMKARAAAEADYKAAGTGWFSSSLKDGTKREDYLKEREAFHMKRQERELDGWLAERGVGGRGGAPAAATPASDRFTSADGSVWERGPDGNPRRVQTEAPAAPRAARETPRDAAPEPAEARPRPSATGVLAARMGKRGAPREAGYADQATDRKGSVQQQFEADAASLSALELARKYDPLRAQLARDQIERLNRAVSEL